MYLQDIETKREQKIKYLQERTYLFYKKYTMKNDYLINYQLIIYITFD